MPKRIRLTPFLGLLNVMHFHPRMKLLHVSLNHLPLTGRHDEHIFRALRVWDGLEHRQHMIEYRAAR